MHRHKKTKQHKENDMRKLATSNEEPSQQATHQTEEAHDNVQEHGFAVACKSTDKGGKNFFLTF